MKKNNEDLRLLVSCKKASQFYNWDYYENNSDVEDLINWLNGDNEKISQKYFNILGNEEYQNKMENMNNVFQMKKSFGYYNDCDFIVVLKIKKYPTNLRITNLFKSIKANTYEVYEYKENKYQKIEVSFENLPWILPLTVYEYPINKCEFKFFDFDGKEIKYGQHQQWMFEASHKNISPFIVNKVELPTLDYSSNNPYPNVKFYCYTFINKTMLKNFLKGK